MSPPRERTVLAAATVIAGAALLGYANTLSAPFIFDDLTAITGNPSIRHLWTALTPPVTGGGAAARPLVNLSFALNYALGGLKPEGYHALNLLIHVAASLTLFGLIRRTLGLPLLRERWGPVALPVAFLTALLWTVHPLNTESVTCVVQRTESLAGLWYLLMFYCLVRAAEAPLPRRWLAGGFTACLLGMFTKEVMVAAPVLAVLFQVRVIDGGWRTAWARQGKFFAALAACWIPLALLVAHNLQRHGAAGFGLGIAWWEYALTQCRAILHYLALAFWPHPLVLDYGDAIVRSPVEVWPQILGLAGLLAATAVAWARKMPAAFAGVWFFAILAPSSSVLPLVTQTVAEHRMYLPLAAVIVLAVTGAWTLAGRRSFVFLAVLAAILLAATVRRNADYHTALDIWRDTVAKAPDNARAHNNLGDVLDDAGRIDEAMHEYELTVGLMPRNPIAHYNLANLLARRGRLEEAAGHFRESIRLEPRVADTHTNLGNTLALQARWSEAAEEFALALQIDPGDEVAHYNLGNALLALGRPAEAGTHFAAALRIRPGMTQAREALARLGQAVPAP